LILLKVYAVTQKHRKAIVHDDGAGSNSWCAIMCVGSYIAVEFAGIYNGMGSKVDLIYRKPTPLTGFDEEMRAVVASNLKGRGINCHPNTNITKVNVQLFVDSSILWRCLWKGQRLATIFYVFCLFLQIHATFIPYF
jgi:hypothetical protein